MILTNNECAKAISDIPDRVGEVVTRREEEEAVLVAQDKLSREDERNQWSEWWKQTCDTEYHAPPGKVRHECHHCIEFAIICQCRGKAPWEGKPLEGSDADR